MRFHAFTLLATVTPALVGCDPPSNVPNGGSIPVSESRDSAGIAIMTILAPLPGASEWRLSTYPTLEIGSVGGNRATQFYQVVGGSLLTDGRIVIADRGSSELRFFDTAGGHFLTVGGAGGGPGEFHDLQHLQSIGDSLHVYDGGARRFSVFDDLGRFVRTIDVSTPPALWQYAGRLAAGERVFGGLDPGSGPPLEGLGRDRNVYVLVSAEGTLGGILANLDGPERVIRNEIGPTGRMQTAFTTVAFTAYPRLAVLPRHLVIGAGERYELQFVSPDGILERIVRWDRPSIPVSDSDIRSIAEESPDPRQVPRATVFPAHGPLTTDRDGRLWVSDYRMPGEEGAVVWNIFGQDGAWLGMARIPADLRILEIGESHLLGAWRDSVGVEYVRLYELSPPV